MNEENKFYRSCIRAKVLVLVFVVLILLIFSIAIMIVNWKVLDAFTILMIMLLVSPLIILWTIYFIYWLISIKRAKKSCIELCENFMIINNFSWLFKEKQEYIKISYNDIKEVKIFFDFYYKCYNINIYKIWCTERKDIATFELKISDYHIFFEKLQAQGVTVSKCSHF